MEITTIGLDLAKNVFQVHGVNAQGKAVLRRQLRRDQVAAFFANLPPCLVGMEACSSAHHWARKLQSMGHTARLMAPQFVKPYVKSNKYDAADAEAICEAVTRTTMRFVPIKNIEQQAVGSDARGVAAADDQAARDLTCARSPIGKAGLGIGCSKPWSSTRSPSARRSESTVTASTPACLWTSGCRASSRRGA